ncbi:MAG: hypothetical protein V4469_04460 [Patescibacteria group bacterium]
MITRKKGWYTYATDDKIKKTMSKVSYSRWSKINAENRRKIMLGLLEKKYGKKYA